MRTRTSKKGVFGSQSGYEIFNNLQQVTFSKNKTMTDGGNPIFKTANIELNNLLKCDSSGYDHMMKQKA